MFQLIQLQETVRIMPSEFGKPIRAIMDALNQKYPNKVKGAAARARRAARHPAALRTRAPATTPSRARVPQVISNQGLCIAIYDLVHVGEAHLHLRRAGPGDRAL